MWGAGESMRESELLEDMRKQLTEIANELCVMDLNRVLNFADRLRGQYRITYENGGRVITVGEYDPNWRENR